MIKSGFFNSELNIRKSNNRSPEYYKNLIKSNGMRSESGCGRRVYLTEEFAIKTSISFNRDWVVSGINQNRVETIIYNIFSSKYEFLAKVIYSDDELLVMGRLESDPDIILEFVEENYKGNMVDKFYGYIVERFGSQLKELYIETGLYLRDLYNINNWAICYKSMELKLIDYGALEQLNCLLDLIELYGDLELLREYDC